MRSALRLTKYLKPYWRLTVVAPLLMLVEVILDLMQPRLLERIVDQGVAQGNMALVLQTGLLMVGAAIVGATGGGSNGVLTARVAQGAGADLREDLFRKVQTLSFGNLDVLQTGQLVTRLTNDVTQAQRAVTTVMRMLIRAPFLMVGGLVMALFTAPHMAFIPLGLMPIILVLVAWVLAKTTPMYASVQTKLDALNQSMQKNLAGIRVVKAFVRADHEKRRFGERNADLADQALRTARITVTVMPIMMMTVNVGTVCVLWFGSRQVLAGDMQIGTIMAYVNYLSQILRSLMMVSMMVVQLSRAIASADRIQEVLDTEPQVANGDQPAEASRIDGRVAFENVTFDYDGDGQDPALNDVSFVVEPGQTVALLGATGSGKSTLVHLIPRFYDVTSGRVTLDGHDVRELDTAHLRSNVGIALQETVLFSGSIRDNIRYGKPEASDEEVMAAAKMAQAHEFVMSFTDGYDTLLGQRGVNLSGGQRQRLAIARALLIDPPVLVLDDSTSSVDVETEAAIQEALGRFGATRSCVVIAQRISTVLSADQIVVLDEGEVVAAGSHGKLIATSPHYQEIYDSQLGNGSVAHG